MLSELARILSLSEAEVAERERFLDSCRDAGPLRERLRAELDALLKVVFLDVGLSLDTYFRGGDGGIPAAQSEEHEAPRSPLEDQLHDAFHERALSLAYQPQIDLGSGEIVGAEALMRWHQPEGVPVPPDKFIPLAEANGLIVSMGQWALDTALAQAREWNRASGRPIRIAVNISARQFHHEDFVPALRRSLEASALPPRLLELDITETLVAHDPQTVLDLLRTLKGIGVRLALDDFGAGNSSLSSLKVLPLDVLKIDRSIIRGVGQRGKDDAITSAIVDLGRGLGLGLIAEGVETLEQEAFLKTISCPEAQGYRFCRPVPASAVTGLLLSPRRQPG